METLTRGFGYTFFVQVGCCFKNQFFNASKNIKQNTLNLKWVGICALMFCMIIVNVLCVLFFSRYDTYTLADVNVKDLTYVPVLIIMAITGSVSVLGLSLLLSKWKFTVKIFSYFGINSLFIMATHLQFYLCAVGKKISSMTVNSLLVSFLIVVIIEVVLIKVLDRPIKYLTNKTSDILKRAFSL